MTKLALYLLGPPKIEVGGAPVTLRRRKAIALLAYLATVDGPHSRDALATLLWPGYGQTDARSNLRRTLYALKSDIGEEGLHITVNELDLGTTEIVWSDVQELSKLWLKLSDTREREASRAEDPMAVLQLYRGSFLEGFTLEDSPEFDAWQMRQADLLRVAFLDGCDALISELRAAAKIPAAIAVARRALEVAPERETLHRALMELYALDGQRASALRQYEVCRTALKIELDVAPDPHTQALYEDVRTGQFPHREMATRVRRRRRPPIPALPTAFVERDEEMQDIVQRLRDPKCRLLTLIGPGGTGKTYLANQTAKTLSADMAFPDGVYWVELSGVSTPEAVTSAMADALDVHFHRDLPELTQLINLLSNKKALLVLDNFEHLLDAADTVTTLLAHAADCKLLVTSRVTLQLRGEWLYTVAGMLYPGATGAIRPVPDGKLLDFAAVRLFVQAALRQLNDFDLDANRDAVVAICRTVNGMPLALELAAVWLRRMSCEEIAHLIANESEALATRQRDVPARQSSIRTIFDHSWAMLPERARQCLARLSVLRGHFGRQAAQVVANVTVYDLETLIDHSFVQHNASDDSYTIHELLRQFAARRLARDPELHEASHEGHATYYAQYLINREAAMLGPDQIAALDAINARIDNIRAAWHWSIAHARFSIMESMVQPLFDFYTIRSKFREGLAAAEEALAALEVEDAAPNLLAQLHNRAALCSYYVGKFSVSAIHATKARDRAVASDAATEEAFALRTLGMNAQRADQYQAAEEYLNKALDLDRIADNLAGEAATWYLRGATAIQQTDFERAARRFQQSLILSRRLERSDWVAYALDMLGFLNLNLGNFANAAECFDEALALFEAVEDWRGAAKAMGGSEWARLHMGKGDVHKFAEVGEDSVQIFEAIGERDEASGRLWILSHIHLFWQHDTAGARHCIDRAVQLFPQPPISADHHRVQSYSGLVAVAEQDFVRARRELMVALTFFRDAGDPVGCGEILTELAAVLAAGRDITTGSPRPPGECQLEAVRWFSMIRANSRAYRWRYVRDWVDEYLSRLSSILSEKAYAAAEADGEALNVEEVVASLLGANAA